MIRGCLVNIFIRNGRIQWVACKYAVGQVLQDSAIGNNLLPLLSPVNVCCVKMDTGWIHSQTWKKVCREYHACISYTWIYGGLSMYDLCRPINLSFRGWENTDGCLVCVYSRMCTLLSINFFVLYRI